jgi:hypothetical protein
MAVREAIQKNKYVGVGTAIFLFLLAALIIARTFWPTGSHGTAAGAFYSDDDGKSYFSDTIFHFPPYERDGRTVYAAMVYSSGSGNFVGILARYKPETKKLLEDAYAKTQSGEMAMPDFKELLASQSRSGFEFKVPGSDKWQNNLPFVKAPDGGDCMMVMP